MSCGWKLYKATKLLTSFNLKAVNTFFFILEKKTASYKILKEIRVAMASVVRLVYLSSNLQIIILRFTT